jgi:hypothetical protein
MDRTIWLNPDQTVSGGFSFFIVVLFHFEAPAQGRRSPT